MDEKVPGIEIWLKVEVEVSDHSVASTNDILANQPNDILGEMMNTICCWRYRTNQHTYGSFYKPLFLLQSTTRVEYTPRHLICLQIG